jgi:hypothetical protein
MFSAFLNVVLISVLVLNYIDNPIYATKQSTKEKVELRNSNNEKYDTNNQSHAVKINEQDTHLALKTDQIMTKSKELPISGREFANMMRNNTLTKELLNKIRIGELEPNQSIKLKSPTYTALVACLFLDENITPQKIEAFLAEGAIIFNSETWTLASSRLSVENLSVLLNNGLEPGQKVDGIPLTNLALFNGNFEAVELLESLGYPLAESFIFESEGENSDVKYTETSILEFLGGSQASRKKAEIENYLKIREGQL